MSSALTLDVEDSDDSVEHRARPSEEEWVRWAEAAQQDRPDHLLELDEAQTCAMPGGPESYDEIFDWPDQLFELMEARETSQSWFPQLLLALGTLGGLHVNTDYSGMAGPEMSLETIINALIQKFVNFRRKVVYYRASDILQCARRVLKISHTREDGHVTGPQHVFGDLMSRVPPSLADKLRRLHERADSAFRSALADDEDPMTAAKRIGQEMMGRVCKLLESHVFDINAKGWCYKCKKCCPLNQPATFDDSWTSAPSAAALARLGRTWVRKKVGQRSRQSPLPCGHTTYSLGCHASSCTNALRRFPSRCSPVSSAPSTSSRAWSSHRETWACQSAGK